MDAPLHTKTFFFNKFSTRFKETSDHLCLRFYCYASFLQVHSFLYKNSFIRTRASYLTKSSEQAKNTTRLIFSKN